MVAMLEMVTAICGCVKIMEDKKSSNKLIPQSMIPQLDSEGTILCENATRPL